MSQTMMDLGHPMEMYPCDHWVLQDANYNVLGLVDHYGKLVERYEYSPYGERKVFVSAGNNDAGCYAPTLVSWRRTMYTMVGGMYDNPVSVPDQPFGLCEFGHQGLPHEEEIDNGGMIQNRDRIIVGGQYIQRDKLNQNIPGGGYHDGMNLYRYAGNNPIVLVDPYGTTHSLGMHYDVGASVYAVGGGSIKGSVDIKYEDCCKGNQNIVKGKETIGVDLTVQIGVGIGLELNLFGSTWGGSIKRPQLISKINGSHQNEVCGDFGSGCIRFCTQNGVDFGGSVSGGAILSVSAKANAKGYYKACWVGGKNCPYSGVSAGICVSSSATIGYQIAGHFQEFSASSPKKCMMIMGTKEMLGGY